MTPDNLKRAGVRTAWAGGTCCVPMWVGGVPSGHCGRPANGPQYPRAYLAAKDSRYILDNPPYCFGPCCEDHGGPAAGEPIIFQDGLTEEGRPMWCAVMPGFTNLQECAAVFSGNPAVAVRKLLSALEPIHE